MQVIFFSKKSVDDGSVDDSVTKLFKIDLNVFFSRAFNYLGIPIAFWPIPLHIQAFSFEFYWEKTIILKQCSFF